MKEIRTYSDEGKNIESDFIQDREDYELIPDNILAAEMGKGDDFLVKEINKWISKLKPK